MQLPAQAQECSHTITLSEWPVAVARSFPLFQSQMHTVFLASSPTEAKRWGETRESSYQEIKAKPLCSSQHYVHKWIFPHLAWLWTTLQKQRLTLNIYSLERALKSHLLWKVSLLISGYQCYRWNSYRDTSEVLVLAAHLSSILIYYSDIKVKGK